MRRSSLRRLVVPLTTSLAVALGCATSSPYQEPFAAQPIQIGDGEELAVDRVILIFDASGSMDARNVFPGEKAWVESFVQGMPEGDYQAKMQSFGGGERRGLQLAPFRRDELATTANSLRYIGEDTPLDVVLLGVADDLAGAGGENAIIIVSDGVPNDPEWGDPENPTLTAGQTIVDRNGGEVCFHTVLAGEEEEGRELLESISILTECGTFRRSSSIVDQSTLAGFERDVFVVAALPAVAAPAPGDFDGDGVVDLSDACPGTPRGAAVDPRGCWVLQGVRFGSDSAAIVSGDTAAIDDVATVLAQNPDVQIEIAGYTDSTGAAAYNQKLSERRAESVKQALVERGIPASRLTAKGFGAADPVADNATPEGRAQNRRIEFDVIQ